MNPNISYYKIKESFKEEFEKALKKVHLLHKSELNIPALKKVSESLVKKIEPAKILKKKRKNKYTYYIQSNPINDYYIMMEPKKFIKSNDKLRYTNYQKSLNKIINYKKEDFNADYGIKIAGKKTKKLEKLYPILDSDPRVLRYFHNKTMNCISTILYHKLGFFILDIYSDRIIEGLVLNFDFFHGFYKGRSRNSVMIQKFMASLNKKLEDWVKNKFQGALLKNN